MKSAAHGKIFKTTSVKNLSAYSNNFLKSKVNDTFLMTLIKFPFQNVISSTVILKIMHVKPHLLGCVSEKGKLSAVKKTKSFEGSFRNLNFSPSTSILLNFVFPFLDIRFFFKFKTTILSNNRFAK